MRYVKVGVQAEQLKTILHYVTSGYRFVERRTDTLAGVLVQRDDACKLVKSLPVPIDTSPAELGAFIEYSRTIDGLENIG